MTTECAVTSYLLPLQKPTSQPWRSSECGSKPSWLHFTASALDNGNALLSA
ncbi:hypothetical protein SynA1560_02944 [Synechococcus sp. A15-60]|nr:hypothetical protein SynA1560_02944 [Synechococcus sp. A15-60]